jgi:hypothetical protein
MGGGRWEVLNAAVESGFSGDSVEFDTSASFFFFSFFPSPPRRYGGTIPAITLPCVSSQWVTLWRNVVCGGDGGGGGGGGAIVMMME